MVWIIIGILVFNLIFRKNYWFEHEETKKGVLGSIVVNVFFGAFIGAFIWLLGGVVDTIFPKNEYSQKFDMYTTKELISGESFSGDTYYNIEYTHDDGSGLKKYSLDNVPDVSIVLGEGNYIEVYKKKHINKQFYWLWVMDLDGEKISKCVIHVDTKEKYDELAAKL